MNKPTFSIITVCYNAAPSLERTIKSVISQKGADYEYIIIDGGSRDGTRTILEKYKNKVSKIVSEKDNGLYHAMNKGAALAKGEYLFFLNAGDTFYDDSLLKTLEQGIKPFSSSMVYGKLAIVNSNGEVIQIRKKLLNKWNIRLGTKVSQQAVFVKREVFHKLGGLNEKYHIASDFDLLCKIIEGNYIYRYVDLLTTKYDNTGISSDLKKSYSDTESVIKDRYGVLFAFIYRVKTFSALVFVKFFKK